MADDSEAREELASTDSPMRFDEHLGIRTRAEAPGSCIAEMLLQPEHRNIEGWIHGGVFLVVLDTAMGHAIASLEGVEDISSAATMQLSCQFLSPPQGRRIEARGTVVRLGRTSAFIEGSLRDDAGVEIARAHGVWRIWRNRK
jgi:uncharacterized protein (TIGR00369 family)